jgi:glycine cleavage system H protein
MSERVVEGYTIDVDLLYDGERHLWMLVLGEGRCRVGMDPLGVETMGDVVQMYLQEPGVQLNRGDAFGTIEAAKFVGPLSMPISGTVLSNNAAVASDPGLIGKDPFGDGWLIEIEPRDPAEFDLLLRGEEQVVEWFQDKVTDYADKGMLAE